MTDRTQWCPRCVALGTACADCRALMARLAPVRADRIRRNGQPEPDMDRVRRSAEASHRMAHG